MPHLIAPSVLSANFANLQADIEMINNSEADWFHVDVMDGVFVPNISFGFPVLKSLQKLAKKPLDVHLMIYNPFAYIEPFIQAGADSITFHVEATEDVEETLQYIRRCSVKAGLAVNPETSLSLVLPYLTLCDLLLLMTVHPGFGGQLMKEEVLEKVTDVRAWIEQHKLSEKLEIQVDGGIDLTNTPRCVQAGANVLVAGTSLYGKADLQAAIAEMRQHANASRLKK